MENAVLLVQLEAHVDMYKLPNKNKNTTGKKTI